MSDPDSDQTAPASTLRSPERLESFFDAVLAIAITIMVLSFELPQKVPGSDVGTIFWVVWPQIFHYAVAFAILATFWIIHHRIFAVIRYTDSMLVLINITIIFFTCLVPFSTSLNMDADVGSGKMILFQIIMLILALLFLLQWMWVKRHPAYLNRTLSDSYIRINTFASVLFPTFAFIALLLAFVIPDWSSFAYFGIFFGMRFIHIREKSRE